MITPSMIYWMTRCDSIRGFFDNNFGIVLLMFLCLIIMVVTFIIGNFAGNAPYEIFSGVSDDEYRKKLETMKKISRRSFYLMCFLISLNFVFNAMGSFIPTTEEMCAIAVIPKIANSESVQDVGQSIVELAKDWMAELKPKTVKGEVKSVVKDAKDTVRETVNDTRGAVKEAAREMAKDAKEAAKGASDALKDQAGKATKELAK